MAKVVKIFTTIRNNWKKSTFAAVALSYGVSYSNEKYEWDFLPLSFTIFIQYILVLCFRINQLMRKYCEEAVSYGDIPQPVTAKQKKVLVILNPVADKKSASDSVCCNHFNTPGPWRFVVITLRSVVFLNLKLFLVS